MIISSFRCKDIYNASTVCAKLFEEYVATPSHLVQQLIHSPTLLSIEIKSQTMSQDDLKSAFDIAIFYRF